MVKDYSLICDCGDEFNAQFPEELKPFEERLAQFAKAHQKCGGIREFLDGKPGKEFAHVGRSN